MLNFHTKLEVLCGTYYYWDIKLKFSIKKFKIFLGNTLMHTYVCKQTYTRTTMNHRLDKIMPNILWGWLLCQKVESLVCTKDFTKIPFMILCCIDIKTSFANIFPEFLFINETFVQTEVIFVINFSSFFFC